jgi:hypothetical protein
MNDREKLDSESDEKVCFISGTRDEADLDYLKNLVRGSQYICSSCGRAALSPENLCSPEKL